jgi:uncharacterized repeat protein (TIGR03803 family)
MATLITFNLGNEGQLPYGGLLADAAGDLFGTTLDGGANGGGTVFELVNKGGGNVDHASGSWRQQRGDKS